MAKQKMNRRRDNRDISKICGELSKAERKLKRQNQKARAVCTHTSAPFTPNVTKKVLKNGEIRWVCRSCQEEIDFHTITDDEIKKAIEVVTQACNFVKVMSGNSDGDNKLLDDVITGLHYNVNVFLMDAYHAAKKNATKRNTNRNKNGRGRVGGTVTWD